MGLVKAVLEKPEGLSKTLIPVSLFLGLSFVFTFAITFRALPSSPDLLIRDVFFWQVLVWLPWPFIYAGLNTGMGRDLMRFPLLSLSTAVLSMGVAAAHVLWLFAISSAISPFKGAEDTLFGVFRWFGVFWFFMDMFLFWAVLGFLRSPRLGTVFPVAQEAEKSDKEGHLCIRSGKASEVFPAGEVIWVEAQNYYSALHLPGKSKWVSTPIKGFEKILDPGKFIRVHRSAIINLSHLKRIKNSGPRERFAVLDNGDEVRISHSGWEALQKNLKVIK